MKKTHTCFIVVLSSGFQKPVREKLLCLGAHLFVEKPETIMKRDEQFRISAT